MADKQLTESAWKAFAKGKPAYKDSALLKAFGALDKAEKAGPDDWLEALDEVDKQADVLRRANKADKDLGSQLDDIEKAVAKERKAAEAARAKAAAAASADEEEETPALLTTKMVPLLRQVRKGDVVMQVLIATTGKDTAVLVSRKAIAPTRIKLLKEYLGASGAVKAIKGECLLEENAVTFVLQTQAAGMAKKLKAALLAQTELRLKVRVRGEDPNDIDDDGDPADAADAGAADAGAADAGAADGSAADGSAATASGDAAAGTAGSAAADAGEAAVPPPAPPSPAAGYEARLAELMPRADAGLAQPGPHVAKLQALLDFARGKAAGNDHLSALRAIDTLAKLLDTLPAAGAADAAGDATDRTASAADPAPAFNARLAALVPRIKPAAAADPAVGESARLKLSEAGVMARKKDFAAANALLDEAEALLAAPAAGTGDAAPVEAGKAFTARLAAMQKAIQAAMAGPLAAELRPLVAALAAAGRTDIAAGERALDAIEALLTRGAEAGGGDAGQPAEGSDEATYTQRLAALEADYLELLAANPAGADGLRLQMAYAAEQAEAGNHAAALAGLQRLQGLMATAAAAGGATDTGYAGLVAYRKTLVNFKLAVAAVESQISGFKSAIPDQLPGETELADELIETLGDYNADLKEAIDDAMSEAENEDNPTTQALIDRIDSYLVDVASHPLIEHVDNNPFGLSLSVKQTLVDALSAIRDAMPKPVSAR